MKRVTIIDVAKEAGVSRQTVSRAVNNRGEIRAETRERVLEAVKRLGYRPNRVARGMVTQRMQTIGLVLGDIANPFFPEVARGVQDVALANDYHVFLYNTDNKPDIEMQGLDSLEAQTVDGIILFSHAASQKDLLVFANRYRPVVLINRMLTHAHVSSLMVDNFHGAQLAVQHLAAQGHTQIGMLTNSDLSSSKVRRVQGFRQALEARGLPLKDEWIVSTAPTLEGGYHATHARLTRYPQITALFGYNDLLALGALRACHELGRQVPKSCGIVGFDDIHLASMVTPSLSTIRVDKYKIGQQAMQRLLMMIEQPKSTFPPIELDVELVVRESSII